MEFDGKIVIVTGAGSGIGRSIAIAFAHGNAIVVVADIDGEKASNVEKEIISRGGKAVAIQIDVTNNTSVKSLVERVIKEFGTIHILVNNVGGSAIQPFINNTEEYIDRTIALNLKSTIYFTHTVLDHMLTQKNGKIINIASTGALRGTVGAVVYSASKGGVVSFTKALAREVAKQNITVTCVCPGPTETSLWNEASKNSGDHEQMLKTMPLGRIAQPEEVAEVVLFLASEKAILMTGQTVCPSGGYVMI